MSMKEENHSFSFFLTSTHTTMNWEENYTLSRSPEGRNSLLDSEMSTAPKLQASFIHFFEEAHVISYTQFWERLILMRNLCISDNQYVKVMVESGVIGQLLLLCRYITLSSASSGDEISEGDIASSLIEDDIYSFIKVYPVENVKKVIRAISQLLANMVACSNSVAPSIFYSHIAQRHEDRHLGSLSDLTAAAMLHKEQVSLQAIWMIIINVISKTSVIGIRDMCCNEKARALLKQLMMSLHSQHDVKVDEKGDMNLVYGSSEGCQLFCLHLLKETELPNLLPFFLALGHESVPSSSKESENYRAVTLEQVLFLFVLVSVVEDDVQSQSVIKGNIYSEHLSNFVLHLADILVSGLSLYAFGNANLEQFPSAKDRDIFHEFGKTVMMDFCVVSTHLMSAYLCLLENKARSHLPSNSKEVKSQLSAKIVAELAKAVLIGQDPVSRRTFEPRRASNPEEEVVDKRILWTREMVRRSLQLLSLLVIHSPESQDIVLGTPQLLGSLLQHCATDFANPLAREWALLCVRNLCEESEEARNRIDAMRPQKVVQLSGNESHGNLSEDDMLQEEAFRKAGLTVSLDPQTGKLSVERKQSV